jgi:MFS family permease
VICFINNIRCKNDCWILVSAGRARSRARKRLMNTERAQVGWGFWLWWVLASTVGGIVGLAVGIFVWGTLSPIFDFYYGLSVVSEALMFAVGGAVCGGLLGIIQRRVLQRQTSQFSWWVEASTVGGAVSGAVGGAVALVVDEAQILAMVPAVGGALVGIAQWLVLRRQVDQAGYWVLASTVGWAMGGAVALVLGGMRGWDLILVILLLPVGGMVATAWYGAITGGVLVWLLRQPITEEPSLPQDAE